jgi:nicotinamide-nucleotide adenylyltransferase
MHKPNGLFIGRFQPFHRGHLLVISGMVKVCRKVVIVIGSSQKSGTEENPFSAAERKEMIQRTLQAENIIPVKDVTLVQVPDCEDTEMWVEDVLAAAGPVDKIWTGDAAVMQCFEGTGVEVQEIKEVPGISGTEARLRMKEDGKWEALVHPEVKKYIKEIKGAERVKKL